MKSMKFLTRCGSLAFATAVCAPLSALAQDAAVDLSLRPVPSAATVGQPLRIELHAESDSASSPQSVSALDVILEWDPSVVTLEHIEDDGDYVWLASHFANDSGLDGLNNSLTDGDAYYSAFGQLGNPAVVTAAGLHVTTFVFSPLVPSPSTQVQIVSDKGLFTRTSVWSGVTAGVDVSGQFQPATFIIQGEPFIPGDGDNDLDVDLFDYLLFLDCTTAPFGGMLDGCEPFDLDLDSDVDLHDFRRFQFAISTH